MIDDLALVTIVLLLVRQYRIARFTCAAQAAAVVMAWGVAMDRHDADPFGCARGDRRHFVE